MSLEVSVRHRFGAFALDAQLTARHGLTALFGPSGTGKTTIIHAIAGLVRPDEGRIALDGEVLLDTAARRFVPAHRRRIGTVFQEGRLFPHLSVRQNLLYGRWFSGLPRDAAELDRVVSLLGIGGLLERQPQKLSGGEKQRVAIGRALLSKPRLLLMDEPLASLDEARKAEILPYIERLRDEAGVAIVYVSHAISEVARLATTIVVVDAGRVLASGQPGDMLRRIDLGGLADADEAGTLIEATVAGHDDGMGLTTLTSRPGLWQTPRIALASGTPVRLRIKARDVMLAIRPPEGMSALNIFAGTIVELGPPGGASLTVRLDCNGCELTARITRASVERLGLRTGLPVHALIKSVTFENAGLAGPWQPAAGGADREAPGPGPPATP